MQVPSPHIRPRVEEDLPHLEEVLAAQQAHSGYPYVWPRPTPVTDFVRRRGELAAWTVLTGDRPVGHVSLLTVTDCDPAGPIWAHSGGCPVHDLACVAALFVDHGHWGQGLGTGLLRTATDWALERSRVLCLDVVPGHDRALEMYRRRGWRVAGSLSPSWLDADDGPLLLLTAAPGPA